MQLITISLPATEGIGLDYDIRPSLIEPQLVNVFVKTIHAEGKAESDGRFRVHDQVVSYNGCRLLDLAHAHADRILSSPISGPQLTVILAREIHSATLDVEPPDSNRAELNELKEKFEESEQARAQLGSQLEQANATIERLKAAIDAPARRNSHNELQVRADALAAENEAASAQISQLTQEVETLSAKNSALEARLGKEGKLDDQVAAVGMFYFLKYQGSYHYNS